MQTQKEACSLLRRLGIILYESLLLLSLLLFMTIPVLFITGGEAVDSNNLFFKCYLISICILYFLIPWRISGQTLAMQTWRVKVEQNDGSRITVSQGLIRWFVAVVSWACLGMGFIWSFFHPEKKTWHDLASGTRLLYSPKEKKKT